MMITMLLYSTHWANGNLILFAKGVDLHARMIGTFFLSLGSLMSALAAFTVILGSILAVGRGFLLLAGITQDVLGTKAGEREGGEGFCEREGGEG